MADPRPGWVQIVEVVVNILLAFGLVTLALIVAGKF